MATPGTGVSQWATVDEGWGRKAVDFATLSEPGNCREYVAVHHRIGVDAGDRLLDVACGSGLAVELARLRGASCCDLDASPRLVAVARDRNPGCDRYWQLEELISRRTAAMALGQITELARALPRAQVVDHARAALNLPNSPPAYVDG